MPGSRLFESLFSPFQVCCGVGMSQSLSAASGSSSSNGDESEVSDPELSAPRPVKKKCRQQKPAKQEVAGELQTQICATPSSKRTPMRSTPRSSRRTPPSSKGRNAKAKQLEREAKEPKKSEVVRVK